VSAAGHLALAVALAWLMPWRAVRTIREQQRDIRLLIRTVADVVKTRPPAAGEPPELYRAK
jgi:hypothetical protein